MKAGRSCDSNERNVILKCVDVHCSADNFLYSLPLGIVARQITAAKASVNGLIPSAKKERKAMGLKELQTVVIIYRWRKQCALLTAHEEPELCTMRLPPQKNRKGPKSSGLVLNATAKGN